MPAIEGLRSPYVMTGPLVFFGRSLDKIRLEAVGKLPESYRPNLGKGFDGRLCTFLGVRYEDLVTRTLAGGSDAEVLAWALEQGRRPQDWEFELFNTFLMKRGWRDDVAPRLKQRLAENGLPDDGLVATMFDYIDVDEGREPGWRAAAGC